MTTYHYCKVHNKFKLNGKSFNAKTLKTTASHLFTKGLDFEKEIGCFLLDWLNEESEIIAHTSGSTGHPKQVKLDKNAMVNSAIATGVFFNIKEGNKALLCLPAHYIAGKMMLVRAMVLGLEIDCVNPKSIIDIKGKIYAFSAMVPLQAQNSLKSLTAIKTLIIGGALVSPYLKSLFKNIKTEVYETYGMTETITHIAVKKLNNFGEQQQNSHSFFKILPNINIAQDERNCLIIQAPKLTKERIITNDVVILHSETEFEWLGRYDNIINSGGVKINPEQVEKKIKKHIEERFFITSEKDVLLGEKVILVIEKNNDVHNKTILNKLKSIDCFDAYEIPKKVISTPKFEETASGKIKRKETINRLKS